MDIIVKQEEGLDLGIVSYNVLPTTKDSGMIEIVEDSDTIYFIQQKLRSSILNYILEENGNIKIKELRDKFIKSTAAYCVITYLLGVGDRHLDNIMITKDGRLFHIDFGFILGQDPKFDNPGIRITPEIIEAIGGLSSVYYLEFQDICTRVYNCLRRNIGIFMNMLLLLPKISNVNLTDEQIRKQVIARFRPGDSPINAKLHLDTKLKKENYTDRITDFCHYYSKEKTVRNSLVRLKNAISNLWIYNPENNNDN